MARARSSERAQAGVEYLGVVVGSALLVLALVSAASGMGGTVASEIERRICEIVGSGCEANGGRAGEAPEATATAADSPKEGSGSGAGKPQGWGPAPTDQSYRDAPAEPCTYHSKTPVGVLRDPCPEGFVPSSNAPDGCTYVPPGWEGPYENPCPTEPQIEIPRQESPLDPVGPTSKAGEAGFEWVTTLLTWGSIRSSTTQVNLARYGGYHVRTVIEPGNFRNAPSPVYGDADNGAESVLVTIVKTTDGQAFQMYDPQPESGEAKEPGHSYLEAYLPPGVVPSEIKVTMLTTRAYEAGGQGPSLAADLADGFGWNVYSYELDVDA